MDISGYDHVFYTGPIDAWFKFKYGRLGYRTVTFETHYADGDFQSLDPGVPPAMPDWSPVNFGSRYWKGEAAHPAQRAMPSARACLAHGRAAAPAQDHAEPQGFWGALGCSCFAF